MSIYVTILSEKGNPNKFTAKLPHFLYLTEKDWEVALVKLCHPVIDDVFWTKNDSRRNRFSFSMDVLGAQARKTKSVLLPPRKIKSQKEMWIALAFAMERVRGLELTSQAALNPYDDKQATDLLKIPHVKITNNPRSDFLDSIVVEVPRGLFFSCTRKFAERVGIVDENGNHGTNLAVQDAALDKNVDSYMTANENIVNLSCNKTSVQYLIGPNMTIDHFHKDPNKEANKRIFLYSDIVLPQIVGSNTKGLLRELFVTDTTMNHQYEPNHLIHLPVRKTVFDTIDIEMKGDNDDSVEFHTYGVTSMTLWFSRRSLRETL